MKLLAARVRRLLGPDASFLRRAGTVAVSNTIARGLSLVFSILVARLLGPDDYGILAYGIAVSGVAAILVTNAPASLARFLRAARDESEQSAQFASSQIVVWVAVGLSALGAFTVLAFWKGGSLPFIAGVLANVVGLSILYTHRQTQRGLLRFLNVGYAYVGANLIQLIVALAAIWAGYHSAIVMLFIYGLSPIPAVLLTELRQRTGIPFRLSFIRRERIRESARFVLPLTVHSAATSVWFAADMILVQHYLHEGAAGTYGVAKTLANLFILVPSGLTSVLLPMVVGRGGRESRVFLIQSTAVAAASGAALLIGIIALGDPLVVILFGRRFGNATRALLGLAPGMALYGLLNVIQTYWVGRGRPGLSATSAVLGTVGSVLAGFLLIPSFGLTGAGIAFAVGSAVQIVLLTSATLRSFRQSEPDRSAVSTA